MDAPSNASRDEPASEREAVLRLRAALRSTSDYLDEVLTCGVAAKGRSADDQEAWQAWHEDRHAAVLHARQALRQTRSFSDAPSTR